MTQWYKILGYMAHQGTGNLQSIIVYIFANDIIHALNKYKKVPGVKRDDYKDIVPLSKEDSIKLEDIIINDRKVSLSTVKNTCYYGPGIKFD